MLGFNDLSTPLKAIIALAFVLILVVIAGLLLRRIAGGRLTLSGQGGRSRQPRLGVVDIFELDRQRQLVLLRRDNVEHLVMIGGPNDVVIEPSIVRGQSRAASQPPAQQTDGAETQAIAAPGAPPQLRVARQETARGEPAVADKADARPPDGKPSLAPAAAVAGITAGAAAAGAAAILAAGRAAEPAPVAARSPAPDSDMAPDMPLGGPLEAPEPALQPLEPLVEARRLPEFLRQDVRYGERPAKTAEATADAAVSTPLRAETVGAPAVEALATHDRDRPAAPDIIDSPATIDIADQLAAELEALVAQPVTSQAQAAPQAAPQPAPRPAPHASVAAPEPEAEPLTSFEPAPEAAMPRPDAAEELARELERMLGVSAQPIAPAIPMPESMPEPAEPPPIVAAAIDAAPVATAPARAESAAIDFEAELARAIDLPPDASPEGDAPDTIPPEPVQAKLAPEPPPSESALQEGAVQEAALQEHVSPEPAAQEPGAQEPGAQEPGAQEPVAPESASSQPTADDPFSVDAIEAEFARLLNRPINR